MIRTKDNKIVEALLYCENCKTWTKHVSAGKHLVCECGEVVLRKPNDKDVRMGDQLA